MKKCFSISILLFSLLFLEACLDDTLTPTPTVHPSAAPLLKTMEAIGGTATAYAATLTPTLTPTKIPDQEGLLKAIRNGMKEQLGSSFGAKITVKDVKLGPIGSQYITNLYIEIDCASENNSVCPTSQVMIALMETCKDKKKQIGGNVPETTDTLTVTIFDPVNSPRVVEIDWSIVQKYMDEKADGEEINKRIRYTQYR